MDALSADRLIEVLEEFIASAAPWRREDDRFASVFERKRQALLEYDRERKRLPHVRKQTLIARRAHRAREDALIRAMRAAHRVGTGEGS